MIQGYLSRSLGKYIIIICLALAMFLLSLPACDSQPSPPPSPPTLDLKVTEGPVYSEEDGTCYYIIDYITTGYPEPLTTTDIENGKIIEVYKEPLRIKVTCNSLGQEMTISVVAENSSGQVEASIVLECCYQELNNPPVADAGGPYEGIQGEELTFDGTGSEDSDGEIVEYAWDFADESTGTGAAPVHTYSVAGEYEIFLIVTDDDGDNRRV